MKVIKTLALSATFSFVLVGGLFLNQQLHHRKQRRIQAYCDKVAEVMESERIRLAVLDKEDELVAEKLGSASKSNNSPTQARASSPNSVFQVYKAPVQDTKCVSIGNPGRSLDVR